MCLAIIAFQGAVHLRLRELWILFASGFLSPPCGTHHVINNGSCWWISIGYQTSYLAGLLHRPRLVLLWKTGSGIQGETWVFLIKKKEADVRGKEIGWTDRFFFLGKIFVISNNLGKVKFNFCMSKTLFRSTSFWNFVSSSYSFKLHFLLKIIAFYLFIY